MREDICGLISQLQLSLDSQEPPVCFAINTTGLFDWQISEKQQLEKRSGGHAFSFGYTEAKPFEFVVEYLDFMVNMGYSVAYILDKGTEPNVILVKAWKPNEEEPDWSNVENPGVSKGLTDNTLQGHITAHSDSIALEYGELRSLITSPRWHNWKANVFHRGMKTTHLHNLKHPLESFRGWDFDDLDLSYSYFEMAELSETSFCRATLREVVFRGAYMISADLTESDLTDADLYRANLRGANLRGATLRGAILSRADLEDADLTAADLSGATLSGAILVNTKLCDTDLSGCNVHGISAWNVDLQGTIQTDLVITPKAGPTVTVDNLAMAQFMFSILNNDNLRHMIDTVTTRVVLILGRFTPERKRVLDAIRNHLRTRNLVPIVFDFEKPSQHDLTETVSTLAHLSKYVVADLTDAKSVPQELSVIVPNLPSVTVVPVIHASQSPYIMFEHFKRFPLVLPMITYQDIEQLIERLQGKIAGPNQPA